MTKYSTELSEVYVRKRGIARMYTFSHEVLNRVQSSSIRVNEFCGIPNFTAYPPPTDFLGLSYCISNYQLIKIKTPVNNLGSYYLILSAITWHYQLNDQHNHTQHVTVSSYLLHVVCCFISCILTVESVLKSGVELRPIFLLAWRANCT